MVIDSGMKKEQLVSIDEPHLQIFTVNDAESEFSILNYICWEDIYGE